MILRRSLALGALTLLALAGCESADPTRANDTPSGELSFSYAGASAGGFNAEGQLDRRNVDDGTWAAGQRATSQQTGEPVLAVVAQVERNDGLFDQLYFTLNNPAVGLTECTAEDEECDFDVLFALGYSVSTEDTEALYWSVGGSVRITSISAGRVAGEFVLELEEAFPEIGTEPGTVQVTAGTFDVPLI
jgi:hypothetical protein